MTPTPRGENYGVKSVKFMSFSKILHLLSSMDTKIVNFMTPGAEIVCK